MELSPVFQVETEWNELNLKMVYLFLNESSPIIMCIAIKSMVTIDGTVNLLYCLLYI